MSDQWRCAVCEGVNEGGRTCSTCGAVVSLRSIVSSVAREELEDRTGLLPGERVVRGLMKRALNRVLDPDKPDRAT